MRVQLPPQGGPVDPQLGRGRGLAAVMPGERRQDLPALDVRQ